MHICLISVEIFAWGKYGGFGRATRTIGRELVKRGYTVTAVVPRRSGQGAVEDLDGIRVLGFAPENPLSAIACLRDADADIYHSCEPSFTTWLAMRAMPGRKHMVTFRDPRDLNDWRMEFALPSLSRLQVAHNFLFEHNPLTNRCIRRMDAVFTIANYLVPKVRRMYRLDHDPTFLPTPVAVPERVEKATRPTVCYVARLDRRKRPRLFLDLAARFPDVHFIAMGKSRNGAFDADLRRDYRNIPNLEMVGFVDQFGGTRHAEILEKSWVMVNTATREALPNAFLEAAAHRCAILAHVDPDGFASRFGYHVHQDAFASGLRFLLEDERWRVRGELGHAYVRDVFETSQAMDRHVAVYQRLLCAERGAPLYVDPSAVVG
ncbi:MAG: glycosyltransferase family 4 protein, partial [Geminicoccaceae bacterium]|nr:glycosyltransferase family 4 protein [Geminicoccaceae bacterium]